MSSHRAMIAALATLFVTGMASSVAWAGCGGGCGWARPAVFVYQPAPLYVSGGCGGCGATYAQPVYAPPAFAPAPPPIAPAPIAVDHWDTAGCGWGGCGGFGCGCGGCGCRGLAVYARPPAPIYVVRQGPEYTGPGIMVPYGTYAPEANLAAPHDYPYVSRGYGYGHRYWHGHRYGYGHRHRYGYAHHYGYAHRPAHLRNY